MRKPFVISAAMLLLLPLSACGSAAENSAVAPAQTIAARPPAQAPSAVSTVAGLEAAIANARAGEKIVIAAGAYDIADLKIRKDLTLAGEGDVVFFSSTPVAKGLINPLPGVSLRVENITFRGARSPDKNGAGLRHDGANLTIVNCVFAENENGVLATGGANGEISITGSAFTANGHGDGYSHGIYVYQAALLEISDSRFVGTKVGHHVKSLADKTVIANSFFDDENGAASYALDASKGGDVTFSNNRVAQAASAGNRAIINYDLTRGGEAAALRIQGNRIINRHPRGKLLRNDTGLTPIITGNEIINQAGGSLDYDETALAEQHMQIREEASAEPDANGARAVTALRAPRALRALNAERAAPKNGKRSGLLFAPEFDRSEPALVYFKLRNNWRKDTDRDYFTFGQTFEQGALAPKRAVAARFGDQTLPAQLDVKSLHQDGSVRHGAVTIKTPALKSGRVIEGALIKAEAAPIDDFDAGAALRAHYDFPLSLKFYFGDETTRDFTMNAHAAAIEAFANEGLWLDGPLVKEARIEAAAAPHLTLRFDIRVYRDGDIRTSVVFSDEKTFSNGRREALYDLVIGDRDAPAFAHNKIAHHRSANWRKIFWTGGQPKLHIIHDLQHLISTRTIAPLDASLGVNASISAVDEAHMKDQPPLSPALITKYFPTTGGRADIGLFPQWTSHYLVAQTERAKRVMLANADAGGAVPWHFMDEMTGAPVSIEQRPKFWSDERGLQDAFKPDGAHRDLFASADGGWSPDHSHKPALSAVPWLVTADRYYADELAMQGAYAIFGRWPDLREGGLKAIDVEQVRAGAWSLRDLSDAAWLLPDNHLLKDYLARALSVNLALMKEKYIGQRAMRAAGELEGYFEEAIDREPERISPWQNDYMAMALWLAAWRGEADAADLLQWTQNFHTGRILSGDFPLKYSAAYLFPARGIDGAGPVASWAALAERFHVVRRGYGEEMDGFPGTATGYFGSALAALTALASTTGDMAAFEALGVMVRYTDDFLMWRPAQSGGVHDANNFLFALIMPDGGYITHDRFRRKNKGGPAGDFLYGGDSGDHINGGGGSDALFGFNGDDEIIGGPGNDVLSGGAGADRLTGGPGDDRLSGGAGADIFAYRAPGFGADIITDFDPAEDRIALAAKLTDPSSQFMSSVTMSPQGARLSFSAGGPAVLLEGVDKAALSPSNFMTIE